jgi:hypothetical protein
MITAILARRRILLAKQSGEVLPTDMVLLINSPNAGDFSVTTNYGKFTAAKVSEYPYFDTTVTHKLSISNVTFSTGRPLSANSAVRGLFVGVESWGTSNTYTKTSSLFSSCTSLRGIPASWAGLGALTNATAMFSNCTSLSSIPDSWEGLGELTNAGSMFSACTPLSSIPASWEGLGALTNASYMFSTCTSLSSIPDSWEGLGELTNATFMFSTCTSLSNCGAIFTGLAKATDVSYLFYMCTGMQGDIHALYVYLSTKPIAVTSFGGCFYNCTQAVGYGSIPASWK